MKTKIILAALMVVGVLSGKTEKMMNETLNQKQQALVAVAACEAKDDQKTLERILDDAFERGVLTVNEAKERCRSCMLIRVSRAALMRLPRCRK